MIPNMEPHDQQKQVQRRMDELERRIAAIEMQRELPPEDLPPSLHDVGMVPGQYGVGVAGQRGLNPDNLIGCVAKGKHAGRDHQWVVDNDPTYLNWLAEKNLLYAFGFTDAWLVEARELIERYPEKFSPTAKYHRR